MDPFAKRLVAQPAVNHTAELSRRADRIRDLEAAAKRDQEKIAELSRQLKAADVTPKAPDTRSTDAQVQLLQSRVDSLKAEATERDTSWRRTVSALKSQLQDASRSVPPPLSSPPPPPVQPVAVPPAVLDNDARSRLDALSGGINVLMEELHAHRAALQAVAVQHIAPPLPVAPPAAIQPPTHNPIVAALGMPAPQEPSTIKPKSRSKPLKLDEAGNSIPAKRGRPPKGAPVADKRQRREEDMDTLRARAAAAQTAPGTETEFSRAASVVKLFLEQRRGQSTSAAISKLQREAFAEATNRAGDDDTPGSVLAHELLELLGAGYVSATSVSTDVVLLQPLNFFSSFVAVALAYLVGSLQAERLKKPTSADVQLIGCGLATATRSVDGLCVALNDIILALLRAERQCRLEKDIARVAVMQGLRSLAGVLSGSTALREGLSSHRSLTFSALFTALDEMVAPYLPDPAVQEVWSRVRLLVEWPLRCSVPLDVIADSARASLRRDKDGGRAPQIQWFDAVGAMRVFFQRRGRTTFVSAAERIVELPLSAGHAVLLALAAVDFGEPLRPSVPLDAKILAYASRVFTGDAFSHSGDRAALPFVANAVLQCLEPPTSAAELNPLVGITRWVRRCETDRATLQAVGDFTTTPVWKDISTKARTLLVTPIAAK